MKKILIIIGSIVLAIGVALAIILPIVLNNNNSNPIEPDYRSIKAIQVTEEAYCKRDEKELAIYEGMNFRNNDSIKTKNNAYVVLKLDSDKYIYIGSNSDVLLKTSPYDSSKTIIRVNEGSIVTEVKNKLSDLEEFGVETPNSTMAIRGTTFQVEVIKKNNEYEINYRLIEGKIDVSVLESKDGNISVGVFSMNPMEEIKIVAEDSGIIDASNGLDDVLDKYRSKDSSIEITNYESVDDYISKTTKVHLTKKELSLSDIASILDKVRFNYENGILRTIVINSTFDVYDNEVKVASNLVKYEDEKEYKIIVKAEEKEQKMVNGWKKSTFNNSGDLVSEIISGGSPLELEVSETMILEPVYQELTSKTFRIIPSNGAACSVSGNNLTEELNLEEGVVTLTATEQDGMIFMGWYEIDSNGNATLIDNRNKVLSDYDISSKIEEGIVSIQARYITQANAASMMTTLRKINNNQLIDEDETMYLKSGTTFNPDEYIVEVTDGIYKVTLSCNEAKVSVTDDVNSYDPVSNTVADGNYSLNISLVEGQVANSVPFVIEPFTLTIYQPYLNCRLDVTYYTEEHPEGETAVLDNLNLDPLVVEDALSYEITYSDDSTYIFVGLYEELGNGKYAKPITSGTELSGTVDRKIGIRAMILPKESLQYNTNAYLYVYKKNAKEIYDDTCEALYDLPYEYGSDFSFDDYRFFAQYDVLYPNEKVQVLPECLTFKCQNLYTGTYLNESQYGTITNTFGSSTHSFRASVTGAEGFIATNYYISVLPKADCVSYLNDDGMTVKVNGEAVSDNYKELTEGTIEMTATGMEDNFYMGFYTIDQDGNRTLYSTDTTISFEITSELNGKVFMPLYIPTDTGAYLYEGDYTVSYFEMLSGSKFDPSKYTAKIYYQERYYSLNNIEYVFYDQDDNVVDPINNALEDGTYYGYIYYEGVEVDSITIEIVTYNLYVSAGSNSLTVTVDGVTETLYDDSNNYVGMNVTLKPIEEGTNYFFAYLEYFEEDSEYVYEFEYSFVLNRNRSLQTVYLSDLSGYTFVALDSDDEKIDSLFIVQGGALEYASNFMLKPSYSYMYPLYLPERLVNKVSVGIYDSLENRYLTETEISTLTSNTSKDRYYIEYSLGDFSYSVALTVYDPNGKTLSFMPNENAIYNVSYNSLGGSDTVDITSSVSYNNVTTVTLNATIDESYIFGGWYEIIDNTTKLISASQEYSFVLLEDMNIYGLVLQSSLGSYGIVVGNKIVTSYETISGNIPNDYTFGVQNGDLIFRLDDSLLHTYSTKFTGSTVSKHYDYFYVDWSSLQAENTQFCSNSSAYTIRIQIEKGTLKFTKDFTFVKTSEPDTFSPVSFVFGDESLDVDTITYYNETGTPLLKTVTKDGVVVDSPSDITFSSYNSRYSMIMYVNSSASFVDGTNVTFSIVSEGYGLNGLATDIFSPRFFIVGSDNKIHLENEITDLTNITIDTSTQRIVALADCLVSEGLNVNRDSEYSMYNNNYGNGDHRAVEFNIFIQS